MSMFLTESQRKDLQEKLDKLELPYINTKYTLVDEEFHRGMGWSINNNKYGYEYISDFLDAVNETVFYTDGVNVYYFKWTSWGEGDGKYSCGEKISSKEEFVEAYKKIRKEYALENNSNIKYIKRVLEEGKNIADNNPTNLDSSLRSVITKHTIKLNTMKANRAKWEEENWSDAEIQECDNMIKLLAEILSDLNNIL